MTGVSTLQELLAVEEIHSSHFEDWERRAVHPLAKMAFRLAADKERNHERWVRLLIEIAKTRRGGEDLGVSREELEAWIEDEASEARSYERLIPEVHESWVRIVLTQLAHDEATNSDLLKQVLAAAP
jgi:hypothetical protein